jgi:hypothetical protein
MSVRRLIGIVAVALAASVAVATAAADPVPGAVYTGVASDGARLKFTVSPDGTLVTEYQIFEAPGNNCVFYSNGEAGVFQGSPIEQNSFTFQNGDSTLIQGSFSGAQSVSGTFALHQDAIGSTPACDTGTVSWTATTTATPPPGSGGGSGGSGSSGSGGSGGAGGGGGGNRKHIFTTRIVLHKPSSKTLNGQVMSPKGACRAGRTVYLWRGSRRIASTKSRAGGKFSFALTKGIRGRRVRASAKARNIQAGACAAGSSIFIKG